MKEGFFVIAEDKRVVTIDFDLSANFATNNSTLGPATINSGNSTTGVTNYIEAFKCNDVSLICNTDALVPSTDLVVCIKSVSSDLEIDYLDSMVSTTFFSRTSCCTIATA